MWNWPSMWKSARCDIGPRCGNRLDVELVLDVEIGPRLGTNLHIYNFFSQYIKKINFSPFLISLLFLFFFLLTFYFLFTFFFNSNTEKERETAMRTGTTPWISQICVDA